MANHLMYESTPSSIYAAALMLPFPLLATIAGGFFIWASGLNFGSILFTVLGSFGSIAILNSAWTKIELTESGISKTTLLRSRVTLMWSEIVSWSLFEPTYENSYLVLKTKTRKSMVIQQTDVEPPGLPSFLFELRNLAGELGSKGGELESKG